MIERSTNWSVWGPGVTPQANVIRGMEYHATPSSAAGIGWLVVAIRA